MFHWLQWKLLLGAGANKNGVSSNASSDGFALSPSILLMYLSASKQDICKKAQESSLNRATHRSLSLL